MGALRLWDTCHIVVAPVNGFADDVVKVKKHAARRQSSYAKVAVVLC